MTLGTHQPVQREAAPLDFNVEQVLDDAIAPATRHAWPLPKQQQQTCTVLNHALAGTTDELGAVAALMGALRLRPQAHDIYVRGALLESSTNNAVLHGTLARLATQAHARARQTQRLCGDLSAQAFAHRLAALEAAQCAWGGSSQAVQRQLKGLMTSYLAASMTAQAAVMAVELYCAGGHLDSQQDVDLVASAHRLFLPLMDAPAGQQRRVMALIGAQVLGHFAAHVPGEDKMRLQVAAACLKPLAATFLPPPPPPMTPDMRLSQRAASSIALACGPFAATVRARVRAQISELELGAADNRGSARIWLRNFIALITGHDADSPEALACIDEARPCVLFDRTKHVLWPTQSESQACAVRLQRAFAGTHHAQTGVAQLKQWALDAHNRPGPYLVALHGPSGTGKSDMVAALGGALFAQAHPATVQLGTCQRLMDLMGTPLGILSARPGPIASALMNRGALPVVLTINEVDKASAEVQTAFAAITEFNEPFVDAYFDFPLFLHTIVIGCTYNEPHNLIAHLHDRIHNGAVHIPPPGPIAARRYFDGFFAAAMQCRGRALAPMSEEVDQAFGALLQSTASLRSLQARAQRLAQVVCARCPAAQQNVDVTLAHLCESFDTHLFTVSQDTSLALMPAAVRGHDWSRVAFCAVVPKDAPRSRFIQTWRSQTIELTVGPEGLHLRGLGASSCAHEGSCAVLVRAHNRIRCIRVQGNKVRALQGWDIFTAWDLSMAGCTEPGEEKHAQLWTDLDDIYLQAQASLDVTECLLT